MPMQRRPASSQNRLPTVAATSPPDASMSASPQDERTAAGARKELGGTTDQAPPRFPSLLMGLGLGGFIDGIVLHQILQWHHMVSDTNDNPMTTLAGLEANTLADGLFHLATWILVAAGSLGMIRSWRQQRRAPSWRFHLGLLLLGWGTFNLAEGFINHLLLGIHHVRDDLGGPTSWDIAFLIFGAALGAAGWAIHTKTAKAAQH